MARHTGRELRETYEHLKETAEEHPMVQRFTERFDELRGRRSRPHTLRYVLGSLAGVLALFVISLNAMPERTKSLETLPVIGPLARRLKFVRRDVEYRPTETDTGTVMYEELR